MKRHFTDGYTVLFCLTTLLLGSHKPDLESDFIQNENDYSFRGCFIVNADPDCVLNQVFDFQNIAEYSLGAKSIELDQRGDHWYDVTFTYRKYLVFENQSTWRRTLHEDEHRIDFELIADENNVDILPTMQFSRGYYHIKPEEDGCLVEYYQECRLEPGFLEDVYIKMVRDEALNFLHIFKEFITARCVTPGAKGCC